MGDCSSAMDSTISFPKIFLRTVFAWSFSCTIGFFLPEGFFLLLLLQVFFQHLLIVGCLLPCRTKWLPRRFAPMKESIDYEDSIIFSTENTPFFFFGLIWGAPKQNGGRAPGGGTGPTSHRHTSVKLWIFQFGILLTDMFLVHRPTFFPFQLRRVVYFLEWENGGYLRSMGRRKEYRGLTSS